MPRISRVVMPFYPHHITQRGTNRTQIFYDNKDRKIFIKYLIECSCNNNVRVIGYCIMSNHFHLLLIPENMEGLGKCLHGITFQYAQYYNKKYNRRGRLWENRYYSCPVDKDDYLYMVIKYIEENPVRAGIAKKITDWKWSSARARQSGLDDIFIIRSWWEEEFGNSERECIFFEEKKMEMIRKATSTGRPIGTEHFYDKIRQTLGRDLRPKVGGRPKKIAKNL